MKNGTVYEEVYSIPTNGFIQLKCDSTSSVVLTIDYIPNGFIVNNKFKMEDSVIIDLDTRKYIITNLKQVEKRDKVY